VSLEQLDAFLAQSRSEPELQARLREGVEVAGGIKSSTGAGNSRGLEPEDNILRGRA
jgi:hypothetical protein